MILKRTLEQRNGLYLTCVWSSIKCCILSMASSKNSNQRSIQIGGEHMCPDIQLSNNSILEMLIADFFIAIIFLIVLWNQIGLNNFLKRLDMLVMISIFLVGRKLEARLYFFLHSSSSSYELSEDLIEVNFQNIENLWK